MCRNSGLSLNTESHSHSIVYSVELKMYELCAETLDCHLIQKATTPRIVYSGESLLTVGSYFKNFWRTPLALKWTLKQKINHAWRALLNRKISKISKRGGCLRLNFWLPTIIDSRELIFQYFKYEELHENSTIFEITSRHVYWDQDNSFDEKTEVKKISLDCPFNTYPQ